MAVKLLINGTVGAVVLAIALTSPIVARSACIDAPCPPASRTQSAGPAGTLEWCNVCGDNSRQQVEY